MDTFVSKSAVSPVIHWAIIDPARPTPLPRDMAESDGDRSHVSLQIGRTASLHKNLTGGAGTGVRAVQFIPNLMPILSSGQGSPF